MMYKLSQTLLIAIFAFLVVTFVIKFYPIKVLNPQVQPYKVLQNKVSIGQTITYVVDACKYYNLSATVSRTFVDGARYPSIISTTHIKKGCDKSYVSVLVPNFLPQGIYHLELDIVYQINPFRTEAYHFTTESFYVTTESAKLK